jgi:hypothetical protein
MQPDKVLLFLHIPKAAGTTLNQIIAYQVGRAEKTVGEEGLFHSGVYYYPGLGPGGGFLKDAQLSVPDKVVRALGRRDLCAVVGHFWFGIHRHVPSPADYVTLLRHPVDRVASLYYHIRRFYPRHSEANQEFYRQRMVRPADLAGMTLEEFIDAPPFREVDNDQTRRIAGVEPEVGGCTKALLEKAKENIRRHFSVAGVTERFDETLVLLKRKQGWAKDLFYYPRNTNPDRPPTGNLPEALREAILRRNWLDDQLYRFVSARLDEQIAAEGPNFWDEVRALRARNEKVAGRVGVRVP